MRVTGLALLGGLTNAHPLEGRHDFITEEAFHALEEKRVVASTIAIDAVVQIPGNSNVFRSLRTAKFLSEGAVIAWGPSHQKDEREHHRSRSPDPRSRSW